MKKSKSLRRILTFIEPFFFFSLLLLLNVLLLHFTWFLFLSLPFYAFSLSLLTAAALLVSRHFPHSLTLYQFLYCFLCYILDLPSLVVAFNIDVELVVAVVESLNRWRCRATSFTLIYFTNLSQMATLSTRRELQTT